MCIYRQWNIIQPLKEGNLAVCENVNGPEDIMLIEIHQTMKNNV